MPHKDAIARRTWKREYNRKNRERVNAAERARRAANPELFMATKLRYRYNIDYEQYKALMEKQSGLCAICKERAAVDIDHDHKTDVVRGLLCRSCNVGLGQFKDDIEMLEKALAYLRHWMPPGASSNG